MVAATKTKPRKSKSTPPASTPAPATSQDEWIGAVPAGRILGRPPKTVRRLGETGVLTMNRPGTARARFKKSEVLALARANGLDV